MWIIQSAKVTDKGIEAIAVLSRLEFKVEVADNSNSLCVNCGYKIMKEQQRVRIFKRQVRDYGVKADCFYCVSCFVGIHKEEFKKIAVDITMVLMSK
jgi:hypothetical protein